MPYQSKADRERAQWMTLREALTHIGKAERCTLKAALRQLGEAIADREIDARWPHALHLSGDWDEDLGPPRDIRFWKSARFILAGGGRILDDPACRTHHVRLQLIREGKLHYRRVLIRRDDVERIWPAREEGRPPEIQSGRPWDKCVMNHIILPLRNCVWLSWLRNEIAENSVTKVGVNAQSLSMSATG
jgi:hypothetical protein